VDGGSPSAGSPGLGAAPAGEWNRRCAAGRGDRIWTRPRGGAPAGDEPPAPGQPDPKGQDWLILTSPVGGTALAFQKVGELPGATWSDARCRSSCTWTLRCPPRLTWTSGMSGSWRSAPGCSRTARMTRRMRCGSTPTPRGTRFASPRRSPVCDLGWQERPGVPGGDADSGDEVPAALVALLRAELARSQAALAQARERIAELEAWLRQTPRNSSRPPSSQWLGKPPPWRSLRKGADVSRTGMRARRSRWWPGRTGSCAMSRPAGDRSPGTANQ
jgi:hypothetical protein